MKASRSTVGLAFALTALLGLSGLACAEDSSGPEDTVAPDVSIVVDGLDRPTQISPGPDGLLLVAQLAGGENDATGEIVAVDVGDGTKRVVADALDKPTGVLWEAGVMWVMVRQGLLRFDWADSSGPTGDPEVVLDGLPFNGRSEGTLTALGDGRFLYATTGTIAGGAPVSGSGTLWAFDPDDNSSTAVATGLKNGYAHVPIGDQSVAFTEIGDGGAPPPIEEIGIVDLGDSTNASTAPDFGWPDCPADDECPGVERPLAVFPVASTPTGIAALGDDLYVTLFVTGQLMRVDRTGWTAGDDPVAAVEVLGDLEGPHTVLAQPDGSLWISEHLADRIISIRP